ncbi:hypothetical protein Fmac_023980 [Flemingia macrophylla]|uniref:Uncharacterized protein n=1 Tax=Flemingia macrophylla TaxID=520843 RepID=A0ABD1LN33_9FABA
MGVKCSDRKSVVWRCLGGLREEGSPRYQCATIKKKVKVYVYVYVHLHLLSTTSTSVEPSRENTTATSLPPPPPPHPFITASAATQDDCWEKC